MDAADPCRPRLTADKPYHVGVETHPTELIEACNDWEKNPSADGHLSTNSDRLTCELRG